jgi:hypothetical protein
MAGRSPEITATDTTADWLRKRFPNNKGSVRTATTEETDLLNEYRQACEEFDQAEKQNETEVAYSAGRVQVPLIRRGRSCTQSSLLTPPG